MHYRRISCQSSTTHRELTWMGEQYIVVPTVAMLGDIVVEGLGSDGPEFVPAAVLSALPAQWNNRPIVPSHPDGPSSANTPAHLESNQLGTIFNAVFTDGALRFESWISLNRASMVGHADVVTAIRNGEVLENSIGGWAGIDNTPGVSPSGVAYTRRWTALIADHLAMPMPGSEGACSVADGCGTNRAAEGAPAATAAPGGASAAPLTTEETRSMPPTSPSDNDIRDALYTALRAESDATWYGLEAVFMAEGVFVYSADDGMFAREFSLSDSTATLTTTPQPARYRVSYEVLPTPSTPSRILSGIKSLLTPATPARDCAGGTLDTGAPSTIHVDPIAETVVNMTHQGLMGQPTRITISRNNQETPMCDTNDNTVLEALESLTTKLTDLEGRVVALAAPEPSPVTAEPPSPVTAEPPPPVDWKEHAPPEVLARLAAVEKQEADARQELVTNLAAAQTQWTAEELGAMDHGTLTKLSKALTAPSTPPVDFSLQSPTAPPTSEPPAAVPVPDAWGMNKGETN